MCHLRTWWFDWAFPVKLSSLESFIISFLVLGTFAVAQLSEEELRHLVAQRLVGKIFRGPGRSIFSREEAEPESNCGLCTPCLFLGT